MLTSIVMTVMFCASFVSSIPLRGCSEDNGNFLKLLQFGIVAGDVDLKKTKTFRMAGNANYRGPIIQNTILSVASSMIVQEIITEANESSVIAECKCF